MLSTCCKLTWHSNVTDVNWRIDINLSSMTSCSNTLQCRPTVLYHCNVGLLYHCNVGLLYCTTIRRLLRWEVGAYDRHQSRCSDDTATFAYITS